MNFGSVCSGIEAASTAWAPLGWKAQFFSEIEPFPSALLAHRYPHVPNHGDMTKFKDWPDAALDVLCGGTPCQSFSNAGLRAGLDDPRGQLMLTFGAIAARYRPKWLVWENVPGVLSSNGGRDFGAFLGLLGFLGYGFAYRVLDAQFVRVDGFGRAVPQRRNRVFVVGCLGDWRSAAAVLLEREGLRGDSAPRRVSGARVAACLTRGAESSGKGGYAGRRQEDDVNIVAGSLAGTGPGAGWRIGPDEAAANQLLAYGGNNTSGPIQVATACRAKGGSGHGDFESETFVAHTLRGDGFDASEDGTGRGTPLVPCVSFPWQSGFGAMPDTELSGTLIKNQTPALHSGSAVRRLTPTECERLMGFPDGWTAVPFRGKPAADGPRYKALGNSWAVNCARWIGWRIAQVEQIHLERAA